MTYEEAIKAIKVAKAEVEWNYDLNYQIALDMAIEAIEKQIPKKPMVWANGTKHCPVCDAELDFAFNQYTCQCGQSISRSHENDEDRSEEDGN